MIDRKADAQLALACMMAESAFDPAAGATFVPALDPRLAGRYALRGHVTAQDAVFRRALPLLAQRVFYGWLLEEIAAPGNFLVVIRGTADGVEWAIDAEGIPCAGPDSSKVESGFWGLYQTAQFLPVGGAPQPALTGLIGAINGGAVTVTGHSLGGALAAFFACDLAATLPSVRARLIEAPRPGDGSFANLFSERLTDAVAWAYEPDLVPKVPFWFPPLHCLQELDPGASQVHLRNNAVCAHHAVNIALTLDPNALAGVKLTAKEIGLYGNCGVTFG